MAVLATIKDLGERAIEEFNFELVYRTYGEFAKARLTGSAIPRHTRDQMKNVSAFFIISFAVFDRRIDENRSFGCIGFHLPC